MLPAAGLFFWLITSNTIVRRSIIIALHKTGARNLLFF
jgi:hypothetical protein